VGWAKRPTSLLRVRVNISAQWLIGRFVRVLHSKSVLINCAGAGRRTLFLTSRVLSRSHPLVKKVAAVIGVKITKKTVEKTIANAVPILGGLISGGLTYFTFQPMGGMLADIFVKKINGDFDGELELTEAFKASLEEEKELGIIEAEFTEASKS
uniref:hypothetical protein n=1 Tax=Streptococcus suis TaxID=1307 RepID=UPI001EE70D6A